MTAKRFRLDTGCIIDQEENMVLSDEQVRNLLNQLDEQNKEYEELLNGEPIEIEEEVPKMEFIFENEQSFHKNSFLRRIQEEVAISEDMYLYVFFNMGSIILDIDDPDNHIYCNYSFSEIYDNHKKEFTFIKNDEIKGFILEFKEKPEEGEEE